MTVLFDNSHSAMELVSVIITLLLQSTHLRRVVAVQRPASTGALAVPNILNHIRNDMPGLRYSIYARSRLRASIIACSFLPSLHHSMMLTATVNGHHHPFCTNAYRARPVKVLLLRLDKPPATIHPRTSALPSVPEHRCLRPVRGGKVRPPLRSRLP